MIRINPTDKNFKNFKLKKLIEKRQAIWEARHPSSDGERRQNISFAESLNEVIDKAIQEDVYEFIAKVEEAGNKLIREPNSDNLAKYKASVKEFILFATRKSYRVKEIYGSNFTKHRLIETVDSEIETLTLTILAGEVEKINLVAYLDNIKGLLVNLIY